MIDLNKLKSKPSFQANEIVSFVNEILYLRGFHAFSKRALRYYISKGILPAPTGPTKYARYSYEHLLKVLSARIFQHKGNKLAEIKKQLNSISKKNLVELENLLIKELGLKNNSLEFIKENNAEYFVSCNDSSNSSSSLNIQLTKNAQLLITDSEEVYEELQ